MADNTKYLFEGNEYGKGPLVHAVVEHYTHETGVSYREIKEKFSGIPNSRGLLLDSVSYEEAFAETEDIAKRYFVNKKLTDSGGTVFYVSNQWGISNIDGFILKARELGYQIGIIPDSSSEIIRYFNIYKNNASVEWMGGYKERCETLKGIEPTVAAFGEENILETYWRSNNNGISSVKPGMLSNEEYSNLKDELPSIGLKISRNPSPETRIEVDAWSKKAKDEGRFDSIKHSVIHRFFCACAPEIYCTIINHGDLKKFVKKWNARGLGAKIELSSNWAELNSKVVQAVKMRGLDEEDIYLVNTFIYRLKEYLVDDKTTIFGEGVREKPISPADSAINSIGTSSSLNQILYGPPGTGKTYSTVEKAVAIVDPNLVAMMVDSDLNKLEQREKIKARFDQLLSEGQIAFTTFHQSFGYEDFVEGLKAESDDGQISYSVEDGVFKKICERADPARHSGGIDEAMVDFKEKCTEEPVTLTTATGKPFSVSYRGGKTFSCLPEASTRSVGLRANIDHVYRLVLNEAPGGLYYPSYSKAIAKYLTETYNIDVSSTKPVKAEPHVLIIDEINRGNISKIFGELITLLEPGKRKGQMEALTVTLPYSKEPFSIPSNLHVIGTMNTADTSLAKVDIALRRRFEFVELMPKPELLEDLVVDGVKVSRLLDTINQRIELLYDRDHCIGHSYFLGLTSSSSIEALAAIFEKQIIPLLEEYFFEDWALIHRVLGDHLKGGKQPKFIVKRFGDQKMKELMGSDWRSDNSIQPVWKLNVESLLDPQAYIGVYNSITPQQPQKPSESIVEGVE